MPRLLRIHGDNIVECDRCLTLIGDIFSGEIRLLPSAPYRPSFAISKSGRDIIVADLIPGHGRWEFNLQQLLQNHGAPLREATDVLLTEVADGQSQEIILAGLEFCSALPAGNNAWQRSGRALALASVGLPYLFLADVGGAELDGGRMIKAPRFPNPIVPFAHLTASKAYSTICLPIYALSPSSNLGVRDMFAPAITINLGKRLLKAIIEGVPSIDEERELKERVLLAVEILASRRTRRDTLRDSEWTELLNQEKAIAKASWLERRNTPWTRRAGAKVLTSATFLKLVAVMAAANPISVGAGDIPICLIPARNVQLLGAAIQQLYGSGLNKDFVTWLRQADGPLVVVWITGFKPQGEDSRPDRGLVPLARMLFGEGCRILSIVSGPGKADMWQKLIRDPQALARTNGLWAAVCGLGDAVLADSATSMEGPFAFTTDRRPSQRSQVLQFSASRVPVRFTEHDVDTVLHMLFSREEGPSSFLAMSNPPGGDWSGLTLRDFKNGVDYRWTSLPRVSGLEGKRPDHVVALTDNNDRYVLVAIESKDVAKKLETRVGPHMQKFTRDLLGSTPTIAKRNGKDWIQHTGTYNPHVDEIIGVGAFCWTTVGDLMDSMSKGALDAAIGVEFNSNEEKALLHVHFSSRASSFRSALLRAIKGFHGRIEVQVH